MDVALLTSGAVRGVLGDIRHARSLSGSPLLQLDAVTVRLRRDGIADSKRTREWMVGRLLEELAAGSLAALRPAGDRTAPPVAEVVSAVAAAEQLRADFRVGNETLEAWSVLYHRYLAASPLLMGQMARTLRMSERTLRRRLNLGYKLLAAAVRKAEVEASRQVGLAPGTPVSQRVVADESAAPAETPAAVASLLEAVRDEAAVVRLRPGQLVEIGRRPVGDLEEYRLGRIAEWSLPRYALDERFVELTLLVDQGEESVSGRWEARDERYPSLREVLAEVEDPPLVLLGPPGCGKSTLLRRYELDTAADGLRGVTDVVTFFVPLNTYRGGVPGEAPPAPRQWLAEQWAARVPALPPLDELLSAGRMVLLLDALNEVPHGSGAEYRERILDWRRYLQDLVVHYPGNRVLFSCRSLDYSAPLSAPSLRVPQVRIEAMSDEQVQRFLKLYAPASAVAIWEQIAGTAQLEVVRLPYFLRLLVEEVGATGELARGRAALFTAFVRRAVKREIERDNPLFRPDGLLAERDYERVVTARRWWDPHELPERGRLFPKLAELAQGMQLEAGTPEMGQVRVGYDRALELLADERAADVVRAGGELGVLDEDRDRDEVLFRHQLLQEYFAGRQVARQPAPELVRVEWRAEKVKPSVEEVIEALAPADPLPPLPQTGWEETAILGAEMAADPVAYVRAIAAANLALAGRIAAQEVVRARLPEEVLTELRWALVARSRDPAADLRDRIACGYAAGDLGDPRYERRQGLYGEYLLPPLVEITGGVYPIGDDEPIEYPGGTTSAHVPRHEVVIAGFRIGQFPVTNAEWDLFMKAGGYDDAVWWDSVEARNWRSGEGTAVGVRANIRYWWRQFRAHPALLDRVLEEGRISEQSYAEWVERLAMDAGEFEAHLRERFPARRLTEPRQWRDKAFNRPSQPVVGVSWFEARAYCSWLSAQSGLPFRLPTEAEWEATARGPDGRTYAYGETFSAVDGGNTLGTHVRKPTPVGVFPEGDTPEGVADMAGNTTNWTSSIWGGDDDLPSFGYPYDPDDGRESANAPADACRVLRGVGWNGWRVFARSWFRFNDYPGNANYNGGLRVACSQV